MTAQALKVALKDRKALDTTKSEHALVVKRLRLAILNDRGRGLSCNGGVRLEEQLLGIECRGGLKIRHECKFPKNWDINANAFPLLHGVQHRLAKVDSDRDEASLQLLLLAQCNGFQFHIFCLLALQHIARTLDVIHVLNAMLGLPCASEELKCVIRTDLFHNLLKVALMTQ